MSYSDTEAEMMAPLGSSSDQPLSVAQEQEKNSAEEIDDSKKKKKVSRKMFDENQLIKPTGIKAVKERMSKIRWLNHRGNEAQNATMLLDAYKSWAHDFAPSMALEDVVARCDSLKGKKGLQSVLEELREEESDRYLDRKYGSKFSSKRQRVDKTDDFKDDPSQYDVVDGSSLVDVGEESMKERIARKKQEALQRLLANKAREEANKLVVVDEATNQVDHDYEQAMMQEEEFSIEEEYLKEQEDDSRKSKKGTISTQLDTTGVQEEETAPTQLDTTGVQEEETASTQLDTTGVQEEETAPTQLDTTGVQEEETAPTQLDTTGVQEEETAPTQLDTTGVQEEETAPTQLDTTGVQEEETAPTQFDTTGVQGKSADEHWDFDVQDF